MKESPDTEQDLEDEENSEINVEELIGKLKNILIENPSLYQGLTVEEFEKDNDQNFHIDFIASAANCRALNYKLKPMDWMDVKLKAGRIIPALATTTASIAGLQALELMKVSICKNLIDF